MHPEHPHSETPAERRRLALREEARRAILAAAAALLVEDGYERFSMRRLAKRCRYTAPTIYHYFGDKQRLIDAVLEEHFQRILTRLRRLRRSADPALNVRSQLATFVRFSLDNPTHYRLLSMPRPDDAPPPASAEAARALLEAPLEALLRSGRLRAGSVEEAVQCLWAVLHGVISLRISSPAEDWVEDLEDFALDTVLHGLIAPAGEETASDRGGR
jgi:AcrR family transcriptional regulator